MSEEELSERGRRIVAALGEFADDLEAGVPIGSKYTIRQVRGIQRNSKGTSLNIGGV